jgi:hypothetical protein
MQVPAYGHRTHASVGTPHPDIPIRAALLVRAPTHVAVFVNGEKVVKRIVQPRRLVFRAVGGAAGRPMLDVEVADGAAVKLVVNGRLIRTEHRAPFHARFVSSYGRAVRW